MQTHVATRSVAAHLALAQKQLAYKGIPFYVSYLVGDGEDDKCPPPSGKQCRRSKFNDPNSTCTGLEMLRTELGDSSVWCLDPRDHTAIWPNLHRHMGKFAVKHRASFPKPNAIGGLAWAWLMCDAHSMVGSFRNRLFGSTSAPDFLWVLDYDITWVGDLALFISAFEHDPSDLLVAKDEGQSILRKDTYAQFAVRNYLEDAQVYSALLAPVRYSRRMLAATRALVNEGKLAFCETRGPSLCNHPSNPWCRQSSMIASRPDLFSANFSCCKSFSERFSRERWAIWEGLAANKRAPCQLLHRVKLDDREQGAEATKMRKERHTAKKSSPPPPPSTPPQGLIASARDAEAERAVVGMLGALVGLLAFWWVWRLRSGNRKAVT